MNIACVGLYARSGFTQTRLPSTMSASRLHPPLARHTSLKDIVMLESYFEVIVVMFSLGGGKYWHVARTSNSMPAARERRKRIMGQMHGRNLCVRARRKAVKERHGFRGQAPRSSSAAPRMAPRALPKVSPRLVGQACRMQRRQLGQVPAVSGREALLGGTCRQ